MKNFLLSLAVPCLLAFVMIGLAAPLARASSDFQYQLSSSSADGGAVTVRNWNALSDAGLQGPLFSPRQTVSFQCNTDSYLALVASDAGFLDDGGTLSSSNGLRIQANDRPLPQQVVVPSVGVLMTPKSTALCTAGSPCTCNVFLESSLPVNP